jgi:hypothetical protein
MLEVMEKVVSFLEAGVKAYRVAAHGQNQAFRVPVSSR